MIPLLPEVHFHLRDSAQFAIHAKNNRTVAAGAQNTSSPDEEEVKAVSGDQKLQQHQSELDKNLPAGGSGADPVNGTDKTDRQI